VRNDGQPPHVLAYVRRLTELHKASCDFVQSFTRAKLVTPRPARFCGSIRLVATAAPAPFAHLRRNSGQASGEQHECRRFGHGCYALLRHGDKTGALLKGPGGLGSPGAGIIGCCGIGCIGCCGADITNGTPQRRQNRATCCGQVP